MGTYTSKYTGEQIDELLGQVENGGGSGSGYSETVLLENSGGMTNGKSVALNDNITNYDVLLIETCCDGSSSGTTDFCKKTLVLNTSSIKYLSSESSLTNLYDVGATSYGTSPAYYRVVFGFIDSLTIYVNIASKSSWTNPRISKVIGIKYEGGSSSGDSTPTGGYNKAVLFEGVCGATSFTKVDQTITLSQSIKEFDMIGFYQICLYTSNNYKRPKYVEVPADMLIDNFENETNSANRISFVLGYKDETAYWDMAIDSTDTTLVTMSSGSYVTKIVGIKY